MLNIRQSVWTKKTAEKPHLLSKIIEQTETLKLSENRALAYTNIGHLFSEKNEAAKFYKKAIQELVEAQNQAYSLERNRKTTASFGNMRNLLNGYTTRSEILIAISHRDPDLALKSLVSSRPARVKKALSENPDYYVRETLYINSGILQSEKKP